MAPRQASSMLEIVAIVFEQLRRAHQTNQSVDATVELLEHGAIHIEIDIRPMRPIRIIDAPGAIEKKRRIAKAYGMSDMVFKIDFELETREDL